MTAEFLAKDVALSVFTAWFLAQVALKILISSCRKKQVMWRAAVTGGGMPSGHATLVAALSTAVGLSQGFSSVMFIITIVFSILVIHETLQAKKVIVDFLAAIAEKHPKRHLLEELSHSIKEAAAGVAIGVIVVLLFYYI
ncbi:divergent PAP2 family protein [Candidatus Woesearchaeota archaeon]|nr:divergent PAP2 family protein [Candidatus Woesearchaeota archaeon]